MLTDPVKSNIWVKWDICEIWRVSREDFLSNIGPNHGPSSANHLGAYRHRQKEYPGDSKLSEDSKSASAEIYFFLATLNLNLALKTSEWYKTLANVGLAIFLTAKRENPQMKNGRKSSRFLRTGKRIFSLFIKFSWGLPNTLFLAFHQCLHTISPLFARFDRFTFTRPKLRRGCVSVNGYRVTDGRSHAFCTLNEIPRKSVHAFSP